MPGEKVCPVLISLAQGLMSVLEMVYFMNQIHYTCILMQDKLLFKKILSQIFTILPLFTLVKLYCVAVRLFDSVFYSKFQSWRVPQKLYL